MTDTPDADEWYSTDDRPPIERALQRFEQYRDAHARSDLERRRREPAGHQRGRHAVTEAIDGLRDQLGDAADADALADCNRGRVRAHLQTIMRHRKRPTAPAIGGPNSEDPILTTARRLRAHLDDDGDDRAPRWREGGPP